MKTLLFTLALAVGAGLCAQTPHFLPYALRSSQTPDPTVRRATPSQAALYQLADSTGLGTFLAELPDEEALRQSPDLLILPDPNGETRTFRLTRYRMIGPELAALYPDLVTAYGWDTKAPQRRIQLEWTVRGFGASVQGGEEGRWYVAPRGGARNVYQAYYTRDYPHPTTQHSCQFEHAPGFTEPLAEPGPTDKSTGDCQLRELNLALACTGEYYRTVAGSSTDPQAAVIAEMVTAVNRVNGVFRTDLALSLRIINLPVDGGGIELLYDDPATDPYDNHDGAAMLAQNQTTIDNVIGPANYDIGHVFSTGDGGIARLESPCSPARKAQGVTGLANPTGDPFYIDFVAHEFGHQFGATHSFNSREANCTMRSAASAYEPGSGTTIQAYAGVCGPQANVQRNSDAYFHAHSLRQISAYMEMGGGAGCANVLSQSNTEPMIDAGPDHTIPANTPFALTAASGADADGDGLTYCWEQLDLGPAVAGQPTGSAAQGPLFRSRPPTATPTRYFPNLPDLVASGGAPWEVLPQVARTLDFAVTVRDVGAAGYGCAVQDETTVTVVSSPGFRVLSPNGRPDNWRAGQPATVSWDVAGTGPGTAVDCPMVEILLSTDGGRTFPTLLTTTANTGSAVVTAPATTETRARLLVRCADNIFFDVSDGDFNVEQNDFALRAATVRTTVCQGENTAAFAFDLVSLQGYSGRVDYTVGGLPLSLGVGFTPNPTFLSAGATERVTLTVSNVGVLVAGDYPFTVTALDGLSPKTENFTLTVNSPVPAPDLTLPAPGGSTPAAAALFSWQAVPGATLYRFVLCANANCTSTLFGTTPNTSIFLDLTGNGINDGDGPLSWYVVAIDETCNPDAETPSAQRPVIFSSGPSGANSMTTNRTTIDVCQGLPTRENYTITFFDGPLTGPANLSVVTQPNGLGVSLSSATLGDGQRTVVGLTGEENLAGGSYQITVRADDGRNTEDIELTLNVDGEDVPATKPADGSTYTLNANPFCVSNGLEGASPVTFEFDAPLGQSVQSYELLLSFNGSPFTGSGTTVSPGVPNTINFCYDEGDLITWFVEARLANNTSLVSCERTYTVVAGLPVEWRAFTALAEGKHARLSWTVEQDGAHARFLVERSSEDDPEWQLVGTVPRRGGDGRADYTYLDPEVGPGTFYYRLRQEDTDGGFGYSEVRPVVFKTSEGLRVFPNPVSGRLTITSTFQRTGPLSFGLFNALGQQMAVGILRSDRAEVETGGLAAGVYRLIVKDGQEVLGTLRVVVH